jgi:enamine deaminase RidA (YjgF/YER057c/UK114 family)
MKNLSEQKEALYHVHNISNEYFFTSNLSCKEELKDVLKGVIEFIKIKDITIIQSFIFGSPEYVNDYILEFRTSGMELPSCTWVANEHQNAMYGIYIHAVKTDVIAPIYDNNNIVGHQFSDDDINYCYLNGVQPDTGSTTEADQAVSVFNKIDHLLKNAGMEMIDVIRTWFYNKDILSWYKTFNEIRTKFYQEKKIFQHMVPASTGISGVSPTNNHLIASVLSVRPLHKNVTIKEVDSPLQGSAREYGSSFSRAMEINTPAYRKIFISGTASIDKEGNTIHLNDLEKQVQQTLDTVKELLGTVNMSFKDVTRAIAYCKTKEGLDYFNEYLQKHPLFQVPVIVSQNIICRDNLLFEIEVDAIIQHKQ